MSFQNQGFCVAKGTGTINDGEYDGGSRIDHKRSHQWYMDGQEADVFPNKKQATGIPSNNFFTGMINSNISPWGSASSFQSMSSHFADRLFDSETARTANFDERDMPSVSEEKVDMERKLADGQFSNNPLFGLSISSALEDPRSGLNYGGIRKVKVSQVKESETAMPASLEHSYNAMENSAVSVTNAYSKADENNLSMGLAYNEGDGCIMSIGNPYERDNNIFISMGQPYNKGDDGASITQAYNASDDNVSMSHTFSKGDDGFISMGQNYNKADENGISMAHVYSKGHDATISITQGDSNSVPIVQSYSKGESTMISFGSGYDDDDDDTNPSGRLISSYDLMMAQPSLETSAVINDKRLPKSNLDGNALVGHAVTSGIDDASKRKEDLKTSKKVPANSFPSNVRSLLSTGMLDGVPVKYIAWSREKELRGIINGAGYLCGCQTCNFSKVINAYEFERHANCKTKHPNNHIYFENRKTIYGIVQELRSTPQNMLFDVIQTITGSPINLKSFRIWKESFLAATRELQRIYGKDEGKPL